MNLARIAVRGMLWLTGGQYVASAVALASNLYLARLLGPVPFGAFFVVSSTVDVLVLCAASFSFGQFLVQAPVMTSRHWRAALACTAAVSALAVAIAGTGAYALRGRYPTMTLTLFLALLLTRAAWNVSLTLTSLLERALAYRALVACRVAAAAGAGLLALAVALAGGGVASLLAREVGMVATGTVAAWIAVKRVVTFSPDTDDRPVLPEIWRFGFRLSGVQVLETVFHRVDGLLLGALLGFERSAELGYYAQAKYIANIPNVAADAGARAVAYRIYAIARDDMERLRQLVVDTQFWTLRLVLPLALILLAVPGGLCRWVLGPAWQPAAPALQALAFFGPIMILFNNMKMLRLVLHDWTALYRAYAVQLVVLVSAMVVGVTLWGVVGGAASVTVACAAGYLTMALPGRVMQITGRLFGLPCVAALIVTAVAVLQPAVWNRNAALGIVYVLGAYALLLTMVEGAALRRSFRATAVVLWN